MADWCRQSTASCDSIKWRECLDYLSFQTILLVGTCYFSRPWLHTCIVNAQSAFSSRLRAECMLVYYRLDSRYNIVQHSYTQPLRVITKLPVLIHYTEGGTEWGLSEPAAVYRWNPSPIEGPSEECKLRRLGRCSTAQHPLRDFWPGTSSLTYWEKYIGTKP